MTSRDGPGADQQSGPAADCAESPRGPADLLDQLRQRLDRLPLNHPSALPPEAGEAGSARAGAGADAGPAARLRTAGAAAERRQEHVPDSDRGRAGEWALPGMAGQPGAAGLDAATGRQDAAAGRQDAPAGRQPDGPGASAAARDAAGSSRRAGDNLAARAAPWPAAWGYSVEPYRPWFTAGDLPGPWFAVQPSPADSPDPGA